MSLSSIACAVAIALISVAAVPAQQSITVGPNVQISKGLANEPHYEMQIAADPFHAGRLLACSMFWPREDS